MNWILSGFKFIQIYAYKTHNAHILYFLGFILEKIRKKQYSRIIRALKYQILLSLADCWQQPF